MSHARFEWDAAKAAANWRKHGVALRRLLLRFADGGDANHLSATRDGPRTILVPGETMRKEYDFSTARRSPWAGRVKQPVTIRIDRATIAYFKRLSLETKLPYQSLINMYLSDCASNGRKVNIVWDPPAKRVTDKGKGKREKGASRK